MVKNKEGKLLTKEGEVMECRGRELERVKGLA